MGCVMLSRPFLLILVFISSMAYAENEEVNSDAIDTSESLQVTLTEVLPTKSKQSNLSQFYFLPDAGLHSLQVTTLLENWVKEYKNTDSGSFSSKNKDSQFLKVNYDYTLVDSDLTFGLQAELAQDVMKNKSNAITHTIKSSGPTDWQMQLRKNFKKDNSHLVIGTSLGLSPERKKIAEVNLNGNMYSGGQSIQIFGQFEKLNHKGVVGGSLSYLYNFDKKVEWQNQDFTKKNGHQLTLSAFSEYNFLKNRLGVSADFKYTQASDFNSNSDNSQLTTAFINDEDSLVQEDLHSSQTFSIQGYGYFIATDEFFIKPSMSYVRFLNNEIGNFSYDKNEALNMGLTLGLIL